MEQKGNIENMHICIDLHFMCVGFGLHACLCTALVLGYCRVQKRAKDTLEPELHMGVSCIMGAETQT